MPNARLLAAVPMAAILLAAIVRADASGEPLWVWPDQAPPLTTDIHLATDALIGETLQTKRAPDLLSRLSALYQDRTTPAIEREAILHEYLQRLRALPPGSLSPQVLDWFQTLPPLVLTGHEEGPHHPVPLFNLAAAAAGLSNQWAWQRGHDLIVGPAAMATARSVQAMTLAEHDSPGTRGMRAAIAMLPVERLDDLAFGCAATAGGCGHLRPDIELARGNLEWLETWMATAPAGSVMPRLRQARRHLPPQAAERLMTTAVSHTDAGVAAWALSDITSHLPKAADAREAWGQTLLALLGDDRLGAAAALQLARIHPPDWLLEAAAGEPDERIRRRLELVAEMDYALQASEPGGVRP